MNPNNYANQKKRGLKRKLEMIQFLGGCCNQCKYNKNMSALEFHHLDPSKKDFQLDVRKIANTNLESLKKELDKCILLCANCHREKHNPGLDKSNYDNLLKVEISEISKKSFLNPGGTICPICKNKFKTITGKKYCSETCRNSLKNYPNKKQLENQYLILKNWNLVASHFNITRKITQTIRSKG